MVNFGLSFLYPTFLWLLALIPLFAALAWPEPRAPQQRQRWFGLTLRLVILSVLVLALAGAQVEWPVDTITTVFVADVSDSISGPDRVRIENFIREALAQKPDADRAALVLFGGDALVEQLPQTKVTMPAFASTPLKNATDIEAALRLALALLPNEGGRRLVLLSDGQETQGAAQKLFDLAAARQVELSIYPLGQLDPTGSPDVQIEQVLAPSQARQGQAIPIQVVVKSSQATAATLRLFSDGSLAESRPVRLTQGRNQFEFNLPVTATGFRRFRVELEAAEDSRLQNNWGAAFTTIYGPPQLLIVEGQPGEAASLAQALAATNLTANLISPASLPAALPSLAAYDAVILVNVPAAALPAKNQELLASYVRELGRGLVVVGGPESYGAGGYLRSPLEKALPVEMEVRSRSHEPNLAVVLAVDKSGSMGACHCDDPENRLQQQARVVSGLPKIDIAKEAIFQTASVLGTLDYLGVVSFDGSAHWQLEPTPWAGEAALEEAIGGMVANGQTNIYAGLVAAEESLGQIPARVKHIILLSDGWSHSGAYDDLIARLADQGITLSVVAAGGGSATYLDDLARKGGGQYYPATSMTEVPQIFLKETIRAAGHYIIEEPFLPVVSVTGSGVAASPILAGLDLTSAPPLLGYNGLTPKAAARIALLTPRGDPLLATWQYGLGRSVAWGSDLSGRWAKNWLAWPGLTRLVGQMVSWSLPRPDQTQLEVNVGTQGSAALITAHTRQEESLPAQVTTRLIAADGSIIEAELLPSGPQRYRAVIPLPAEGVYLAQVTAYGQDGAQEPVASQTSGVVVPYSAEYGDQSANLPLLTSMAAASGGQQLTDPAQSFAHTLSTGRRTQPIWPGLLLLATLLFPVDVAVRRLHMGRREWQQFWAWLAGRWLRLRPAPARATEPAVPASPTVQAFRQARQRLHDQPKVAPANPTPLPNNLSGPPPASKPAPASEPRPAPSSVSAPSDEPGDTLARLRSAKKRARR